MTYLRELWKAIDSGFRAGRKQYRRMRSLQRAATRLPDIFTETL